MTSTGKSIMNHSLTVWPLSVISLRWNNWERAVMKRVMRATAAYAEKECFLSLISS